MLRRAARVSSSTSGTMSIIAEKSKTQTLLLVGLTCESGGAQFGAVGLPATPVDDWLKLPGKVVPELPFTPFDGMMPDLEKSRSSARMRLVVCESIDNQKLTLSLLRSPKPATKEPRRLSPPLASGSEASSAIVPPL